MNSPNAGAPPGIFSILAAEAGDWEDANCFPIAALCWYASSLYCLMALWSRTGGLAEVGGAANCGPE